MEVEERKKEERKEEEEGGKTKLIKSEDESHNDHLLWYHVC